MASDQNFVDFVVEQMQHAGQIHAKKMFGEYGIYLEEKMVALVCDNKLFIKPTAQGREYIGTPTEAPAYEGAKPSFLIEEELENRDWLTKLVLLTAENLPAPKPKKTKK